MISVQIVIAVSVALIVRALVLDFIAGLGVERFWSDPYKTQSLGKSAATALPRRLLRGNEKSFDKCSRPFARKYPSSRVACFLLVCVLSMGAVALAPKSASAEDGKLLSILAIGDSYTAGNGAGNNYDKPCRHSSDNYARRFQRLIERSGSGQPVFVRTEACTDAVAKDFLDRNTKKDRRAMIEAVDEGYDLIFLTIGGNDLHFGSIVQNCLVAIRDYDDCKGSLELAEALLKDGSVESDINDALLAIAGAKHPNAKVVLIGYPFLEGKEDHVMFSGRNGRGKRLEVGKRIRQGGRDLDAKQQKSVNAMNLLFPNQFVFVSVKQLFAGPPSHELSAPPAPLNANRWLVAPGTDALVTSSWKWYHPNSTGYYQEALLLFNDQRVPKKDLNSSPKPAKPTAPTTPTVVLDAKALEGTIIRRADGVSWVVQAGRRLHIPNYATDICAQFVDGRPVSKAGLSAATANTISELNKKYACNLDNTILRAMDKPDPKPSYAYYGGSRHWVPDPWTHGYLIGRGFKVVNISTESMIQQLRDGGTEPARLDRNNIPQNSIVRRSDGVSWVVDGTRQLHHIPFAQDDVCWRQLRQHKVAATQLTDGQVRSIGPEKDKWPCIIGNRVVKSSDGSSHFVDQANSRHWIPDADTFWVIARQNEVVGPWPAADVNTLPQGPQERPRLDPEAVKNSLVCRNDGVCWAVDGNAVRHHITTHADNVCWRWVNGWKVSRNGVTGEQASSLAEEGAWGCSLHNRIIATNEGAAFYMEGNTRRWIQDGESFHCYADRGAAVIRGMGMGEARGIGEGHWMPKCLSPHRIKSKVVRVSDGTAYFVDSGGSWHWIPDGGVWGCVTRKYPVLINDATWEQVNSLKKSEGAHANCSM